MKTQREEQTKMRRIAMLAAVLFGLSVPGSARAGTFTNDFSADPSTNGFTLSGAAAWNATGGNGSGFVQLTDAVDEQRGALLLPDFDSGKRIQAFTVSMDVRVGAGSDLPGEGWSINFVPTTAQVVTNGADGPGWASDFVPTANLPERGSAEGLGVYALTFDHGGGDILGFNLRYNQVQNALNGWTLPPTGPKVYNGACADIYSLQTGPNTNGVAGLCWANFRLVMHQGGAIDIYWKGNPVVTNFPTPWTPQSGRWILGARTSTTGTTGGNEVHDFDNISITTELADKPTISLFNGGPGGFTYVFQDIPGAVLDTNSIALTLDDTTVSATSISQTPPSTTVTYSQLLSVGAHKATVAFRSVAGAVGDSTNNFIVSPYAIVPASYAVTGIDTSQRGFMVRPYQTLSAQPNDLAWTEDQLAGLHGPNIADLTGADAQGFIANSGVINYDIDPNGVDGHFNAPQYTDSPAPGIPGTTGSTSSFAEEIITWLYFPAPGAYSMGVNSDDGFKVTTDPSVRDPNGLRLGFFNGGRGASDTMFSFIIQAAGYYPFRLVWENGNGELSAGNAANCEWFVQQIDGSFVLVNDVSNPASIRAYRSGPFGPPFLVSFNGGLNGFTYELRNGSTTVISNTVQVTLNGSPVAANTTQSAGLTTIDYSAPSPLPSPSTNVVVLTFADNGTPAQTQTMTNTFTVGGAIVPGGIALTSGVDTTQPGFSVRPYQTVAAQPNALGWTERQLAGLEGLNIADLSAIPNGWSTNADVINLDIDTSANNGLFNPANNYPDNSFPGLPGLSNTTDNASMEIITWINFQKAGSYTMGVDSDDGFKVTTGRNPRDQFAILLGQYDGGRGATPSPFQFYIPEAGFYPMRLIWENGAGGANLEWYSQQSDGSLALINDSAAVGALRAYAAGPAFDPRAYVSVLDPGQDQQNINAGTGIFIQFTDGSTQVDKNSIVVTLNGLTQTSAVNKVGGITTVQTPGGLLPSGSTNTATLVYKEVASATTISNTWKFTVANYLSVPPGSGSDPGTGVASKPGFRVRVAQLPIGFNNSELNPSAEAIEQVLAGLWGTNQALASSNVADLTTFTDNGYFDLAGVVNMSGNNAGTELGNFTTANGFPDVGAPGIPGTTGYEDQFAAEFITYIEFPQMGMYTMGVASDDCFRVYPTDQPPAFLGATLYVTAPAAIAGVRLPGDPTWAADGGFGAQLSTTPIMAKVVAGVPNTACSALSNPDKIVGNIALVDRGTCEFGAKALACEQAGAIACIIVNNRQDLPISLGAGAVGNQVTIPVMMLHQNDGDILKAHLSDPGGVSVTVGQDPELIVGEFNNQGGRGTADTWFSFGIPKAGVYPFRLAWNQGGGGYSCEWFSVDAGGNRTLLNDTAHGGLKAYRERVAPTAPPALSIATTGGKVVITYEGTLQSSTTANGTYGDVSGATNPYQVNTSAAAQFFRARR